MLLGRAAPGPDEQVAAELEGSAQRARARGGVAAAAAFLEHATALTLDRGRRSARALAAAQAWHQAGRHDLAGELLDVAEAGPLDELPHAQAERLRAQVIFVRTDGRDGAVQLLRAARRLGPLDRELARATYVDALRASLGSGARREVGRALRALPLSQPPDATELLLRGVGVIYTEGFPHGTDVLSRALDAFVSAPVTGDENIRALEVAAAVARNHWADAGYDILTARVVALAREAGALSVLSSALDRRAAYCVDAGDLADAAEAYDEAEAIRQATGMEPGRGGLGRLAALRNEENAAAEHIERLRREPRIGDTANRAATLEYALALLYNGLARYPEALAAAQRSRERHPAGGFGQALSELVEAAVRCHQPGWPRPRWMPCACAPGSAAARTGGWAWRPARAPCWPRAAPLRSCTGRRSTGWAGRGCGCRWRAPAWSTGNGCAASGAAATPASSCAPPTTCSKRWAPGPSPNGPGRADRDRRHRA